MEELLSNFEEKIETITLVPSDGGCFELKVNDVILYSKLQTGRHMEPGEAVVLLSKFLKEA